MTKFLDSSTDKKTGESTVTVEYKGRVFYGTAYCHPDDSWSEFFGCSLAETRAMIKAARYELKLREEEYRICKNFIKSISCYKTFDSNSPTAKAMYRQLNMKKKAVTKAKKTVKMLKETVVIQMTNREKFKKVIEKIKVDKSNKSN